jgi:hypothetical protein
MAGTASSQADIIIDLSRDLFQIERDPIVQVETKSVKWTCGRRTYETAMPLLTSTNVASIVEHCFQVLQLIEGRVGGNNWRRVVSYTAALPMTFSEVLRIVWDGIATDHPNSEQDVDGFLRILGHFFDEFSEPDDRYELAQLLLTSRKPPTMDVTAYYCRLRVLNQYLDWLPGDTPVLTPEELKQVFHDGMPERWRHFYRMSGRSVQMDSPAEIHQFFRRQQSFASKTLLGKRKSPVDDSPSTIATVSSWLSAA